MITKHINDSILNTELKFIAHGVNCQGAMGSGVAKVLYEKYPEVREQYMLAAPGNILFEDVLGEHVFIEVEPNKFVINCYTQLNYGRDGKKYVNYWAIAKVFHDLSMCSSVANENNNHIRSHDIMRLAIPKIGCGLAGGDWDIVEAIINDAVENRLEIWVYAI